MTEVRADRAALVLKAKHSTERYSDAVYKFTVLKKFELTGTGDVLNAHYQDKYSEFQMYLFFNEFFKF